MVTQEGVVEAVVLVVKVEIRQEQIELVQGV
jgi:hypothetical protein